MKIKKAFSLFALIITIFCLATKISFSQNEDKPPLRFSIAYLSGQNKPHRPVIENLTFPYRGVELKASWQSFGKQPWQVAYRYPSYGIGLNWSTFKTDILGAPVSLFFFTNFPQVTTRWVRLDLEVDVGMSYGINPYQPEKNPENFSTGSSTNAFVGFHLEQSFHLGEHLDVFTSQGITHYSNGALGYPNLGLNIIPSLKFGMRYIPKQQERINKGMKPEYRHKWQLNTYIATGTRQFSENAPRYSPLFIKSASYNRSQLLISPALYYRTSYKRRVGLGYEFAYNEAITGTYRIEPFNRDELFTHAVFASHEYIIERFTLLAQFGIYLKNMPSDKFYYERLGIGFYLTPWARMVLNIKAHYIKAEYVEAGLVFDLNIK